MVVVFLGQPDGRSCWPWWRLGFPPNHRISGGDGILFLFDFFVRRLMGICSVYSALDIRYRIRIGKVRRHVDQLVVSQKSTQTVSKRETTSSSLSVNPCVSTWFSRRYRLWRLDDHGLFVCTGHFRFRPGAALGTWGVQGTTGRPLWCLF